MKQFFRAYKSLTIFLTFTLVSTCLYVFFVVAPALGDPSTAATSASLVAGCMYLPAMGMLFTRVVTREGFRSLGIQFNLRGNGRYYLAAWLLPVAAVLLGSAAYFLVSPSSFDPNMGLLGEAMLAAGQSFDPAATRQLIFNQMLMALVLAPMLNLATCLGEELGWRGYMMPKLLERFSFLPACLIGGLFWGLWHAPLTVLGHNYGLDYWGYPVTGILAMCVFCIVVGTFFTYLCVRVKSCLPAVLGHAMLNGYGSTGVYFLAKGSTNQPFVGPGPMGIVGGIGLVALAVCCVLLERKHRTAAKGQSVNH